MFVLFKGIIYIYFCYSHQDIKPVSWEDNGDILTPILVGDGCKHAYHEERSNPLRSLCRQRNLE